MSIDISSPVFCAFGLGDIGPNACSRLKSKLVINALWDNSGRAYRMGLLC